MASIAPCSDLRLHDLGEGLSDASVAGKKVTSRWRTAPLWGLGYRMAWSASAFSMTAEPVRGRSDPLARRRSGERTE